MTSAVTSSGGGLANFGQTIVDDKGVAKTSQLVGGYDMTAETQKIADAKRAQAKPYADKIDLNVNKKILKSMFCKQKLRPCSKL